MFLYVKCALSTCLQEVGSPLGSRVGTQLTFIEHKRVPFLFSEFKVVRYLCIAHPTPQVFMVKTLQILIWKLTSKQSYTMKTTL